ncbi:MAG TPA: response regulator [Pirellulales bacterium]|nr:response regulator [Pirellulales bacterium]
MSEEREIVLIVDDDPGVSALQRRRLERAGFQVASAETASAAMEHLRRGGVELVVLDYRLSGEMNGLEFYAAMKQAGYDVPVIMVTGYSQESTVVEALRAGVRDFVSKSPNYIDYLLQAVERLFQQLRMQRQLAESQARLGAVIGSSMDAIITADDGGTITLFNAAAERMFDCAAAEAVGQPIARFSPEMAALLKGTGVASGTATQTAPALPYEMHAQRFNGQPFAIEASLSQGDTGGKLFYTFIVRDVTQRQRVATELRMAKEAAEAANVAKSSFLGNMSHEPRTPMTAILGFTDLLLDGEPNVSREEALEVIKRNGKHLLKIIDDLLDISTIEAGHLTIERVPCSPAQLLVETHALMQVGGQAKGLSLTIECRDSLPQLVYADATRLRQILLNLIGNAIKFTESGEVRIVAEYDASGQILHVEVSDTGIGMTEQEIAGLFRPFTQADGTTTRRFGGAGLGLSISKRLAVLLGGDVHVRSSPGAGSTFRLSVPVQPIRAERSTPLPRPESCHLLAERRILLVEDSPDSQRLIAFVLAKCGAEVVTVENGQLAIDAVLAAKERGVSYDLILMDMQMPVLDGYEATRRLRNRGQTEPIIALTAHAMKGDREKCFDAGCNDYLTKPVDVALLRGKLTEWASRRGRQSPSLAPLV